MLIAFCVCELFVSESVFSKVHNLLLCNIEIDGKKARESDCQQDARRYINGTTAEYTFGIAEILQG